MSKCGERTSESGCWDAFENPFGVLITSYKCFTAFEDLTHKLFCYTWSTETPKAPSTSHTRFSWSMKRPPLKIIRTHIKIWTHSRFYSLKRKGKIIFYWQSLHPIFHWTIPGITDLVTSVSAPHLLSLSPRPFRSAALTGPVCGCCKSYVQQWRLPQ